jgi:hypothetical protein
MDDQGFVDIALVASFNRIKNLTRDVDLVKETMSLTPLLELTDQGGVRLRGKWSEWLLPGATRSLNVVPPFVTEAIAIRAPAVEEKITEKVINKEDTAGESFLVLSKINSRTHLFSHYRSSSSRGCRSLINNINHHNFIIIS